MKRVFRIGRVLELERGEVVVRGDLAKLEKDMRYLLGEIELPVMPGSSGPNWFSQEYNRLEKAIHALAQGGEEPGEPADPFLGETLHVNDETGRIRRYVIKRRIVP